MDSNDHPTESIKTIEAPFDESKGQTLALDVMGEYVVFLKTEEGGWV